MNNKESALYKILANVVACCATQTEKSGAMSLDESDVLGKCRAENVVMTRAMLCSMIIYCGYSVTTAAQLLHRTPAAVRHLLELAAQLHKTSRAYRLAEAEATLLCRDIGVM